MGFSQYRILLKGSKKKTGKGFEDEIFYFLEINTLIN